MRKNGLVLALVAISAIVYVIVMKPFLGVYTVFITLAVLIVIYLALRMIKVKKHLAILLYWSKGKSLEMELLISGQKDDTTAYMEALKAIRLFLKDPAAKVVGSKVIGKESSIEIISIRQMTAIDWIKEYIIKVRSSLGANRQK